MQLIYSNLVTVVPPGYAHGCGIATSSIYKYAIVLYLDI